MTNGEYVCQVVLDGMRKVAPAELGRWEPAWRAIEAPARRLLELLPSIEGSADEMAWKRVEKAARDVVRAWKRAGEEWERRGRPAA